MVPARFVRELGRQTVLMAARDELGLLSRDETLGEPFPKSVTDERKDLHCKGPITERRHQGARGISSLRIVDCGRCGRSLCDRIRHRGRNSNRSSLERADRQS